MMEENLFAYVEQSAVKHAASQIYVKKMSQKKRKKRKKEWKKVTPGWTDISGPGSVSFLSRSSMYYIKVTLHNSINPLNVASTKSFSWDEGFPDHQFKIDGYQFPPFRKG